MTDSVFQLKEVVARGTQAVSPHQTISQEQLSALASNNVADALKYLAGVQIKDYGGLGGQKTVNVRSLGSQHVGVYLDGVRITNAQNGTVDLGKYSLTTLESVSLFNANKTEPLMTASEYASASTIYLRTRRPDSTSLTASYGYGSFNTHKANITYSSTRSTPTPTATIPSAIIPNTRTRQAAAATPTSTRCASRACSSTGRYSGTPIIISPTVVCRAASCGGSQTSTPT